LNYGNNASNVTFPLSLVHNTKKNLTDAVLPPKPAGWDINTSTINELNASIQRKVEGVPNTQVGVPAVVLKPVNETANATVEPVNNETANATIASVLNDSANATAEPLLNASSNATSASALNETSNSSAEAKVAEVNATLPLSLVHKIQKNLTDAVLPPKPAGWDLQTSTINELNASIQRKVEGVPNTQVGVPAVELKPVNDTANATVEPVLNDSSNSTAEPLLNATSNSTSASALNETSNSSAEAKVAELNVTAPAAVVKPRPSPVPKTEPVKAESLDKKATAPEPVLAKNVEKPTPSPAPEAEIVPEAKKDATQPEAVQKA
jgi:hypothetical protein